MASRREQQQPDNFQRQTEQRTRPMPQLEFTREELAVLKECNRESFWYRCVPLSCVLMGLTTYAVRTGHLRGHPTFGPFFKNLGAGFVGFVLGKVSYQEKCREKLSRIEGSKLAAAFERSSWKNLIPGAAEPNAATIPDSDVSLYSSPDDYSNINIDTDRRPVVAELDDRFRPTLDREVTGSNSQQDQLPATSYNSYEELQKRNREDYERRLQNRNRSPPQPEATARSKPEYNPAAARQSRDSYQPLKPRSYEPSSRSTATTNQSGQSVGKIRNKYGDVFEE
ncbi:OCIA domain-containing protein 1-like isoform X2 [Tubulanus polymorphus]|uniref:OCIA domain-containing protein 1-like isoform X2 n=1 Tax=Tubulanus polymorphus TaxID=672921 RepID=UPI003DA34370